MTSLFDLSTASVTLSSEDLREICGHAQRKGQIEWLIQNKWTGYVINKSGWPVVGRAYATMKLAGINPGSQLSAWSPDFASLP